MITSRYVDAWYVLTLLSHPRTGGGFSPAFLSRLFEVTTADGRRAFELELRRSGFTGRCEDAEERPVTDCGASREVNMATTAAFERLGI